MAPKGSAPRSEARERHKRIGEETFEAIRHGSYTLDDSDQVYDLSTRTNYCKRNTEYYPPDSVLSSWNASPSSPTPTAWEQPRISILEISTLEGARLLAATHHHDASPNAVPTIGILNFASATKPGGGVLSGAQAQEESIARSSTLYPSLMTPTAQEFYILHKRNNKGGYYSHAMVYSPRVTIFRNDNGTFAEPLDADVLTSPAVNAGAVKQTLHYRVSPALQEQNIEKTMMERMARILYLFERHQVRYLVLGSFGTGVFKNKVDVIAKTWETLLKGRFAKSFEHVMFAVLGRETFEEFEKGFTLRS
ncbi:hypothetical protein CERSUDRAFT_118268 [Gelatoporia subvermispora B]|uniref:Microbial-type PARG catalytic domain-containing protein n=1 Tax=Ceriporiopsis subvermispora (strain B) TaxID=914234 RepID=M2R4U0_CERS8|nr:hypothetical protein CERSUDRAFT_118268 [Gelatoporia subvermispora B]